MIFGIGTIVVGVAAVHELDPVLPSALRLAESVGARLHVVHVVNLPDPIRPHRNARNTDIDSVEVFAHKAAAEASLWAHCERLGFARGTVKVSTLSGSPHYRLAAYAAENRADLLVIGATRHGRIWSTLLGTTAERVLRKATMPVLVFHQPFYRPVQKVLLTTDLSARSSEIHQIGLDVVEALFGPSGITCRSLYVLDCPLELARLGGGESIEEGTRRELLGFLEEQPARTYPVEGRLRIGESAVEINVEADSWGADLIVLGTHGRSGAERYVFGSVAASTLRDASRNVLVVPALAAGRVESVTRQGQRQCP